MTQDDPSLWMRMYNSHVSYIMNNILGRKGYWRYKNGEITKTLDDNWFTLEKRLKKEQTFDAFGDYLIARDEYYQYEKLNTLKIQVENSKNILDKTIEGMGEERTREDIELLRDLNKTYIGYKKQHDRLEKILKKNEMNEQEAERTYKNNKDRFAEETELYDALVWEDVEFLHDNNIGIISDEKYEIFGDRKGYAPRKREFYDDIVGDEIGSWTYAGDGISSLKERTGSGRNCF
jgi:hypothetical protein